MQEITREFIRALADANGIAIVEEQLEPVRKQYESFMRTMSEIDAVPLTPETDPATIFALAPATLAPREDAR